MSLDLAYITRSIDAAFDLVMRDRRAWDKFDLTAEGFYRSFVALLLVLPLNIIADLIARQIENAERLQQGKPPLIGEYGLPNALFSTVATCVEWAIFPLTALYLLKFLGLTQRYAPLIIAHNWGTIVVWLFSMVPFLLYAANIVSSDDAISLNLFLLVFTLYYRYYTAQTALDAGWSAAASVVMLGFVLQLYFAFGVRSSIGLWVPAAQ